MLLNINNEKIEDYFNNSDEEIIKVLEYIVDNKIKLNNFTKKKDLTNQILDLAGKVDWDGDLDEMRGTRNDFSWYLRIDWFF